MAILIDTCIFVDHLRGHDKATKFFRFVEKDKNVLFSAITEAELVAGKSCSDEKKKEILLQFLGNWNKKEVDNKIAVLAGDICRIYGSALPDALIASTAILYEAELITKNTRDFEGIDDLKIRSPY